MIEQQLANAFVKSYIVTPGMSLYLDQPLDPRFQDWPAPSVLPMSGTWVGAQPFINNRTHATEGTWAQTADGYLYLGPKEKLTQGGEAFDLEGTAYGAELRRRWKILFDKPPVELPKSDGQVRPLLGSHWLPSDDRRRHASLSGIRDSIGSPLDESWLRDPAPVSRSRYGFQSETNPF